MIKAGIAYFHISGENKGRLQIKFKMQQHPKNTDTLSSTDLGKALTIQDNKLYSYLRHN